MVSMATTRALAPIRRMAASRRREAGAPVRPDPRRMSRAGTSGRPAASAGGPGAASARDPAVATASSVITARRRKPAMGASTARGAKEVGSEDVNLPHPGGVVRLVPRRTEAQGTGGRQQAKVNFHTIRTFHPSGLLFSSSSMIPID